MKEDYKKSDIELFDEYKTNKEKHKINILLN